MPDIVLIGDSIVDNKCNNFVNRRLQPQDPDFPNFSLAGCTYGSVKPDLETALTQAGFTVRRFARFGWNLTEIDTYQYPKLVEYAEERDNNVIIIFSGGGNDFGPLFQWVSGVIQHGDFSQGSLSPLWEVYGRVQRFGDKLLDHSSMVIHLTPPFNLFNLGVISSSISDLILGYDEEIQLKYSDFCSPGADNVHPDNACAQQMHQKIIDILGRHECSGGSCECKDAYHGYQCEEDCWETDTRCYTNCQNCCHGSEWYWSGQYCSAETATESTQNSMSALRGAHFVGPLAIFGFISIFYWLLQYCRHPKEFVQIQDIQPEI